MRKIFYGTAIAVGVLLLVVLVGHQRYSATASYVMANDTVNVLALDETIDMNAVPRQNIPPEAYQ